MISAARVGDDLAICILREAGEWLGLAAASMANAFLPDRIAIAGGLSAAGDLVMKPAEHAFYTSASEFARSRASIVSSCFRAHGDLDWCRVALPGRKSRERCSVNRRRLEMTWFRKEEMESIVGRREFLGMSLAFASSLAAAEPRANFPTEARQRLSVSTYPFRSVIDSSRRHDRDRSKPGMTLEQFAETIPS